MTPDQFDKETSRQNFEWHRERALRENGKVGKQGENRIIYNVKAVEKKHGERAANELIKEINSRQRNRDRKYYT